MKLSLKRRTVVSIASGALAIVAAVAGWTWYIEANPPEPVVRGAPAEMRQLTQAQYGETVSAIFGEDILSKVRFAPIQRVEGLTAIGARTSAMTLGALEPIEESARAIAADVVAPSHRERFITCRPQSLDRPDDECARMFLGKVGRLLYRRALTDDELQNVVSTAAAAVGPAGDFYAGLSFALSRMLMSYNFLYVTETIEPDPARSGAWRLDARSKASRLSFFLWNAGPDSMLLDAVDSGELHTRKGLERQVERMLASPRLEQGIRGFFNDMLVFEGFDILAKDPVIYPAFTSKVVSEAREQMMRTIVDHLVARRGDYRDLFATRHTFMTRDLAAVYRVPIDVAPDGWVPYEFPEDSGRAGLLTQVGFLARYSHPGRTSPTQRGRGIRETLLCQHVPDPPPNVNFSLVEDPNQVLHTARDRLTAHRSDPACAGCHRITDPIGLVLENFDGAGQFRTTENGTPIDTSGSLDGVDMGDAVGLARTLRESPSLTSCFVSRLYAYGTGRKLDPREKELTQFLRAKFENDEYRVLDFLQTVVTSNAFYAVQPPADERVASTDHQ